MIVFGIRCIPRIFDVAQKKVTKLKKAGARSDEPPLFAIVVSIIEEPKLPPLFSSGIIYLLARHSYVSG